MIYHFDTADARAYGTDEAILLYNIVGWLRLNKADGRNQFEGRTWTYNSARALAEVMDFIWSEDQIRRLVNKLATKGVLRKGNFNREIGRRADDRTLWLALEDETRIRMSKPAQDSKKDNPPPSRDERKPAAADQGNSTEPPAKSPEDISKPVTDSPDASGESAGRLRRIRRIYIRSKRKLTSEKQQKKNSSSPSYLPSFRLTSQQRRKSKTLLLIRFAFKIKSNLGRKCQGKACFLHRKTFCRGC